MRKEMDKVENVMKEKMDKKLDGMVKKTDSPFTPSVLECPLPLKFRLPPLELFNGLRDPLDHISTFKMTLSLHQNLNEILRRSFPTTLKGAARVWFNKLTRSSIDNFEQLSNSFVCHFVGGQRQKRPADHLLTIKQGEGESLRSYVKRFNKEVLEVGKVEDKVQLTMFNAGLKSKDFVVALAKSPPGSMIEKLLKAQKYMNVEDALAAIEHKGPQKERRSTRDVQRGRKRERSSPSSSRDSINRGDDKLSRTIKDDHALKWPKLLHSLLNIRDKKKYCYFHKDHGHYTEDCRDLKEEIEKLIQKGKSQ
ncbi:uncharacterized protein LOC126704820 [Quercus robur]|uniref:uncharacterized protein LOC126704820 n=1 Tax=Quercus robur TaxID=38942 RepID=UPI0021638D78|nr:uncharacterized protein LOC126704820 [Quercus robur]